MNGLMRYRRGKAFTLLELLMVLVITALIAAALLPEIARRHARSSRVSCTNNVKQIGLAFLVWGNEHGDQFPMNVSTNNGGSKELADGPNVFVHFQIVSNELSTPKILICPNDEKRSWATTFDAGLSNSNISYFVGVSAVFTNEHTFLSGDRNITNGSAPKNGILELTTNRPARWTDELHVVQGNIAFADASVRQLSTSGLREAIASTSTITNRLALP